MGSAIVENLTFCGSCHHGTAFCDSSRHGTDDISFNTKVFSGLLLLRMGMAACEECVTNLMSIQPAGRAAGSHG